MDGFGLYIPFNRTMEGETWRALCSEMPFRFGKNLASIGIRTRDPMAVTVVTTLPRGRVKQNMVIGWFCGLPPFNTADVYPIRTMERYLCTRLELCKKAQLRYRKNFAFNSIRIRDPVTRNAKNWSTQYTKIVLKLNIRAKSKLELA